jgi:DNA-binding CsgD family transcriptional regulator
MVYLPYIPDPYEDELLGLWIAQIALHNGKGAWRAALEYAGYRRPFDFTIFDCAQYSERLAKLLCLLGVTYEALILKLSLLPYRLAFDCLDPNEQRLPGTRRVPALANRRSYHRAHNRKPDDSRLLRWCPVCLDEERYMEQYWHREHQLPNVYVCRRHQCLLHVKCPSCAFAQIAPVHGLLPPPLMKCGCGTDLRSAVEPVSISPAYQRLLQVSYDALNSKIPDWTGSMVREYLKQRLNDRYASERVAYSKIFAAAFGSPLVIGQHLMHFDLQLKTGLLRVHRSCLSANATDCCGLLAAMDISFDEARVGFASQPRLACRVSRKKTPRTAAPDILFAQQQMLASDGSLGPRRGARLYWTLRLYDLIWLKSQYPLKCRGRVPDFQQDRVDMLHILNDRSRTPLKRRALLSHRQSTIRTSLRDFDWYSKQMNWLRTAVTAQRRASARALGVVGKNVVQQALERTLKEQKRPELITAVTLAPLASLSANQVRSILRKNPDLKSQIQRLNEDRPRRLLLWAGREIQKANQPLSFAAIRRKARGSHYYLKYRSLKAFVMEELEHSSHCEPGSGTPPVICKPRKRRLLCAPHEVVRLRRAGCSFFDIGIRLSISDVTAHRLFYQETGIHPQLQKVGCKPADVRHLRDKGWTFPQIENALGICHTTAIAYSQGWKPKSPCRIRDGGGISFKTVLSLYRSGLRRGEIASRLGTAKAYIDSMLDAMHLLGIRLGNRYRGRSVKIYNVPKLVALRDAGLSFAKIARKCRICESRAYHLVRAYQELVLGRKVDINSTKRAEREKAKIMTLRSEGRSMRAIAREIGLSLPLIRRVICIESGGRDRTRKLIDNSAVLELRRQGNSHGTIAQRLGLNRKTVAKIVNASDDLEPCFKRPIVHSARVDKSAILEFRAQGLSYDAIAARTGISRKSVQNRERG